MKTIVYHYRYYIKYNKIYLIPVSVERKKRENQTGPYRRQTAAPTRLVSKR